MRCVILAAGYATRLYPLTRNVPKALLEIGGKTIVDRLVDQLEAAQPTSIHLVTNDRFHGHFQAWARAGVELLNDGSRNEDDRLGAVGDLRFAIDHIGCDEDLLVTAADSLYGFQPEITACVPQITTIVVWDNPDLDDRTRRGNVALDADGAVTSFTEKPAEPASRWSSCPLYLFCRDDLPLITAFAGNPDAPGHLIEWLVGKTQLRAVIVDRPPTDIGTPAALANARTTYAV